jgi:hypothetical protein
MWKKFVSVQTVGYYGGRESPGMCAGIRVKDKNTLYIRYLYRGGESGIRTRNLAGRIHLKNRMNSASCAPETFY